MQFTGKIRKDRGWHIGPIVVSVALAVNFEGRSPWSVYLASVLSFCANSVMSYVDW